LPPCQKGRAGKSKLPHDLNPSKVTLPQGEEGGEVWKGTWEGKKGTGNKWKETGYAAAEKEKKLS